MYNIPQYADSLTYRRNILHLHEVLSIELPQSAFCRMRCGVCEHLGKSAATIERAGGIAYKLHLHHPLFKENTLTSESSA